jgi:hypothetical protein
MQIEWFSLKGQVLQRLSYYKYIIITLVIIIFITGIFRTLQMTWVFFLGVSVNNIHVTVGLRL